MSNQTVSTEALDQFKRVFHKFRQAVEAFPEEEWRTGESDYQRPAGLADHFLSTIDYYTCNLTAAEFPWGKRLGCDWEDPDPAALPSKEMILVYLGEMEARLEDWTVQMDFLAEDNTSSQLRKDRAGACFLSHSPL